MCGEGMGHATRSWPIIRELSARYEVHVFAGGRVYEYLVSRVEHLHWIQTLALVYEDNRVNVAASWLTNWRRLAQFLWSAGKFISMALALRPRVLVTDYEAVSAYMSVPLRLKSVCFDNQHVFGRTGVTYPERYERDARALGTANFATVPYANRYVVSTFYHPPVTRAHTRLVPPVVRPEVLELETSDSDTVLVYQTSASNRALIPTLNQVAGEFVVYGLGRDEVIGNCTLRTFSEVRFLEELARARAVITNGGHTLITEALALGKPVLSEPVQGQFEQILNAIHIERMGVGRHIEKLTPEAVTSFLAELDRFRAVLHDSYPRPDNAAAIHGLEEAIWELSPALRELVAPERSAALDQLPVKPLLVEHHAVGAEAAQVGGEGQGGAASARAVQGGEHTRAQAGEVTRGRE